jgi:hypothetical protein
MLTPNFFAIRSWAMIIRTKTQFCNMIQIVTIEDDYQEIKAIEKTMVTRQDLDALIDSIEIKSNLETMEALHKSDIDIKEGRYNEISSVDDLLNEL